MFARFHMSYIFMFKHKTDMHTFTCNKLIQTLQTQPHSNEKQLENHETQLFNTCKLLCIKKKVFTIKQFSKSNPKLLTLRNVHRESLIILSSRSLSYFELYILFFSIVLL